MTFIIVPLTKLSTAEKEAGESTTYLNYTEIVALRPRSYGTEIRDRGGWLTGTPLDAGEVMRLISDAKRLDAIQQKSQHFGR